MRQPLDLSFQRVDPFKLRCPEIVESGHVAVQTDRRAVIAADRLRNIPHAAFQCFRRFIGRQLFVRLAARIQGRDDVDQPVGSQQPPQPQQPYSQKALL